MRRKVDINGSWYGYKYEWEYVSDETIIKEVINNEMHKLKSNVEALTNKIGDLEKFITNIEIGKND